MCWWSKIQGLLAHRHIFPLKEGLQHYITLSFENQILTNAKEVSKIFNDYYINVVNDIGKREHIKSCEISIPGPIIALTLIYGDSGAHSIP